MSVLKSGRFVDNKGPVPHQDDALVLRLRQRDPQVMAEIYSRYGRLVFSVICAIVHDRARAEDLTQETFVRVWDRSNEFAGGGEFLGRWVMAIARNRAIDHIRSVASRMERKTSELEFHGQQRPPSADLEEEVVSADDARAVRGAVSRLNPTQRQVIELAYYQGLSQTEIATQLGQPLGTVKSWCRTALQNLRSHLHVQASHGQMRAG